MLLDVLGNLYGPVLWHDFGFLHPLLPYRSTTPQINERLHRTVLRFHQLLVRAIGELLIVCNAGLEWRQMAMLSA